MAKHSRTHIDLDRTPSRTSPVQRLRDAVLQSRQESRMSNGNVLYHDPSWEIGDIEMRSPTPRSSETLSSLSYSSSRPLTAPLRKFWNGHYIPEGASGEGSPPLAPAPTQEMVCPDNYVRIINSPINHMNETSNLNKSSSLTSIPSHPKQQNDISFPFNKRDANLTVDIQTLYDIKNREEMEKLLQSNIITTTSWFRLKPGGISFTIPAGKSPLDDHPHFEETQKPKTFRDKDEDGLPPLKRKGYSILPDIHTNPNHENKIRSQRARNEDARRLAEERDLVNQSHLSSEICNNLSRRRRNAAEKARRRHEVDASLITDLSTESRGTTGNRFHADRMVRAQRYLEKTTQKVKRLDKTDHGRNSRADRDGRKSRRDKP